MDTTNDILTIGIKELVTSTSGGLVRIVFRTLKGEAAFQIPTSAVDALLPILARAAQIGKERLGLVETKTVLPIMTADVSADENGQIVFDFLLPKGARFAFQLETDAASKLANELQQMLTLSGEKHREPLRH